MVKRIATPNMNKPLNLQTFPESTSQISTMYLLK